MLNGVPPDQRSRSAGAVGRSRGFGRTAQSSPATSVATSISITPATVSFALGKTQQFTATVLDQFGANMGLSVTWSSDSGNVTINSSTGLATGAVYGNATITATYQSLTNTASATVQQPTQLAMITQPAGATTGSAFGTQPVVELRDSGGNPDAESGRTVTVSISAGSGSLSGTTSVNTDSSGRAVFSDLVISATSPPSSFTLTFASTGLTGVSSSSFTVNASSGAWAANRPAATGTLLTDYLFNATAGQYSSAPDVPNFDGSGWGINGDATMGPVTDATAPQNPSTVARIVYPASGAGGGGTGNFYRNLSSPTRIYVCISFKHSVPFDWNGSFRSSPPLDSGSGSNKFLVLFGPSTPGNINLESRFYADLTGSDPPAWLQVVNGPTDQVFPAGVLSTGLNLDDGNWHKVEWYVDSVLGKMQCWCDDVLQWTWNRTFPGGWDLLLLSSTWGGGGTHAFQCYRYYDRVTVYTN